jgi:ABC-2 type transport system permease protein
VKPEGFLSFVRRTFAGACRDPQTLAITFLAPSAIFIMMWFVMSTMTAPMTLNLGVVNEDAGMGNVSLGGIFAGALGQQDNVSLTPLTRSEVDDALRDGRIDGAVIFGPDFSKGIVTKQGSVIRVIAEGTDQTRYMLITKAVSSAAIAAAARASGGQGGLPVTVETSKLFAAGMSPLDVMKPLIIALMTFLLGFMTAFMFVFRKKADAAAGGLSGFSQATGFTLGLWAFSFVQAITIMLYFQYGIGIGTTMDLVSVAAVLLTLTLAGVACGVLAAGIARKGEQSIFLAIGAVILQIYFGGFAVAISQFPGWFRPVSCVMPLTYAGHALKDIIARGYAFGDVWTDALALVIIAAAAVLLAVPVLGRKATVKTAPELKTN